VQVIDAIVRDCKVSKGSCEFALVSDLVEKLDSVVIIFLWRIVVTVLHLMMNLIINPKYAELQLLFVVFRFSIMTACCNQF